MAASDEIKKLFETRDEAVTRQDKRRFLSTQVSEIENGSSSGYISIDKLKSEVLYAHTESELEKVVFVKETYTPRGKESHSSFPVYFLTNTVKGWMIYKVR